MRKEDGKVTSSTVDSFQKIILQFLCYKLTVGVYTGCAVVDWFSYGL